MARSYQIYPRGFIGAVRADGAAQVAKAVQANIDSIRLFADNLPPTVPKGPPSNKDIDRLYKEYVSNSHQANTFQFYEHVLLAAFDAFGTDNFKEWLCAQAQANGTDYLHANFLKDTVRFIAMGRREMIVESWLPMLSTSDVIQNTVRSTDTTDRAFKEMLVTFNEHFTSEKDHQIKPIVFDWVRQPNGITDLLKTLYILFGE